MIVLRWKEKARPFNQRNYFVFCVMKKVLRKNRHFVKKIQEKLA